MIEECRYMLTLDRIREAHEKIAPYIHRTPLVHSNSFSTMFGAQVYLKAENLQKTGSFKVRGAFHKLLSIDAERVVAASMGNHAQAVAYAARVLGKKAKIIMPVTAPIVKQEATKGYGAEVVLYGQQFSGALDRALSEKDHTFIHAFDDDDIMAGQGTIGLEICDDLRDMDCVLVPVGGGGLIAGVSTAVKALSPAAEVIGIQTESAQSAFRAFQEGRLKDMRPAPTIADGIAVGKAGERTFEVLRKSVDDMIVVAEDSVALAIYLIMERTKLVIEGAGAVPLAALMEQAERFKKKNVVLLLSGGNIDFTLMDRIISKGLVKGNRIAVLELVLEDVPGALHKATGVIAGEGANIVSVEHDRLSREMPVGMTKVSFIVEVRGREHFDRLMSGLRDRGYTARDGEG